MVCYSVEVEPVFLSWLSLLEGVWASAYPSTLFMGLPLGSQVLVASFSPNQKINNEY